MRWPIFGMKRILVFSLVLSLLLTSSTWAQKHPQVQRAKTDDGFWYIKQGNPQKISHDMRELGLNYLEWIQKQYDAQKSYSLWLSAGQINESDELASKSADEILDKIESRMKINTQLPGDKDFLNVLKYTRSKGSLASMKPCNSKDGGEGCERRGTFISCKNWMQESIDSGIFEDSWHESCYGDWAEAHAEEDKEFRNSSGVSSTDSQTKEHEDAASNPQSLGVIGISRADGLGITIVRLIPGGPALLAGLAVGDVITAIDGKPVKRVSEESELVSNRTEGSSLRILYVRGTERRGLNVVLGQ